MAPSARLSTRVGSSASSATPKGVSGFMSEHERMLIRLGDLLSKVARPYRWGDALPVDVRTGLWQVGVPYNELTTREELVAGLWARKRVLLSAKHPGWGGPGAPPGAA